MARTDKTETINVRVSPTLRNEVEHLAERRQTTITAIVRNVLEQIVFDEKLDSEYRRIRAKRLAKASSSKRAPPAKKRSSR